MGLGFVDPGGGGGAVDTVNGIAPDGFGNVALPASAIPSTGPSDVQADLDALVLLLDDYLPLAGGTMSGAIVMDGSNLVMGGGNVTTAGAVASTGAISGATMTATTFNGVALQTGGSALEKLGADGLYTAPAGSDADWFSIVLHRGNSGSQSVALGVANNNPSDQNPIGWDVPVELVYIAYTHKSTLVTQCDLRLRIWPNGVGTGPGAVLAPDRNDTISVPCSFTGASKFRLIDVAAEVGSPFTIAVGQYLSVNRSGTQNVTDTQAQLFFRRIQP